MPVKQLYFSGFISPGPFCVIGGCTRARCHLLKVPLRRQPAHWTGMHAFASCVFCGCAPFSETTLRLCIDAVQSSKNAPSLPAVFRPILQMRPRRGAQPSKTQLGRTGRGERGERPFAGAESRGRSVQCVPEPAIQRSRALAASPRVPIAPMGGLGAVVGAPCASHHAHRIQGQATVARPAPPLMSPNALPALRYPATPDPARRGGRRWVRPLARLATPPHRSIPRFRTVLPPGRTRNVRNRVVGV